MNTVLPGDSRGNATGMPTVREEEQKGETKDMTLKDQGWYHTPAHRRWRKLVLHRDKLCQMCKRKVATEAHHIKSLEEYPELALDLDNGQGLCWDCHEKTKNKKKKLLPKGIRIIKA